jgi:NitT/TauT family transport system substrate-binding protein
MTARVVGRRACLAGILAGISVSARTARSAGALRLGVLQFGTVQWVADVIRHHALDSTHGFTLEMAPLANTDAGRVALMAGAADIVASDWFFVAAQRAAGTKLRFAPFSTSTGGVMTRADSPVRSLADLAGRKLGVAGGPADKSWVIVRAAARAKQDIDLAGVARLAYGAPPLLNAKLLQGELDAVLTFWNFAARLEAAGCRQVVSVDECARDLGVTRRPALVGFVFHEKWAERQTPQVSGFLAATAAAETLLAKSDAEWSRIRPLMNAPDDALFQSLRRRFIGGIAHPSAAEEEQTAARLFEIVLRTGGTRATGGLTQLPPGVFWQAPNG